MDMDQAAVWLAGSILTMLGFVALVIGCVVINNIIFKYWKPIRIFTADSWKGFMPPSSFVNQEELNRIVPEFEKNQTNKAVKENK
jgi:hypothetical protein